MKPHNHATTKSVITEEVYLVTRKSTETDVHEVFKQYSDRQLTDHSSSKVTYSSFTETHNHSPKQDQRKMTASPASVDERQDRSKASPRRVVTASSTPPGQHGNESKLKNWEVFPGRNKFFCDGRIIMARQTGILHLTIILILVTVALFFIFDCRLTLVTDIPFGFFIPIACALLFLFNFACLLRTAWSDPGIIPRASPEEAAYIEKCLTPNEVREEGSSGFRHPPRSLDVVVNGEPLKLKYCFTCKIFRPPRASHCSLCDNCVENFDHHCPWVGNCVGRRNYRYFYLFVSSLTILCIFIFAFAVVNLVLLSRKSGFLDALKISPGSVLEIIIAFFSVWSVVGLSGFHSYLILQSLTTNEDIKGTWSKKRKGVKNPFDHGSYVQNCCYTLCSPLPPSMINRRGYASLERCNAHALNPRATQPNDSNTTGQQPTAQSNKPYPTQPNYPVADREPYDTSDANYPRQPEGSSQSQDGRLQGASGPCAKDGSDPDAVAENEGPVITVTHHAIPIGDSPPLVQTSFNSNNSIGFQQSHYPLPSASFTANDEVDQPGVIIEHLGPVVGSGDGPKDKLKKDNESVNVTVVSAAGSNTIPAAESITSNGIAAPKQVVKNENLDTKMPRISSV